MTFDLWTMIVKEWKEIFRIRGGSMRGGFLSMAIFLSVFGIFLPLQMGAAWVEEGMVLFIWVWVPLFLVSTVVADSFAGERERHTLETLLASRLSDGTILMGKLLASMAYGCGLTLVSLSVGCVTVNLAHQEKGFLFYSSVMCLGIILWILTGAGLAACAGVLVSLKAATVRQAQQTLSIAIMLLLFVPILGLQTLPVEWRQRLFQGFHEVSLLELVLLVAVTVGLIDLILLKIAISRFRRSRLILD